MQSPVLNSCHFPTYLRREHQSKQNTPIGVSAIQGSDDNHTGDNGAGAVKNVPENSSPSSAVAKAASAITDAMKSLLPVGASLSGGAKKNDEGDGLDSRNYIAAKQDDYESDDDDEELQLRLTSNTRVHDEYDEEEADDWGDDSGWKTHNIDRRRNTRIPTANSGARGQSGVFGRVFNW